MEISKENIFKVEYTAILGQDRNRKKGKLRNFIKENKIIAITAIVFFISLFFNVVLIYNFIEILENM